MVRTSPPRFAQQVLSKVFVAYHAHLANRRWFDGAMELAASRMAIHGPCRLPFDSSTAAQVVASHDAI